MKPQHVTIIFLFFLCHQPSLVLTDCRGFPFLDDPLWSSLAVSVSDVVGDVSVSATVRLVPRDQPGTTRLTDFLLARRPGFDACLRAPAKLTGTIRDPPQASAVSFQYVNNGFKFRDVVKCQPYALEVVLESGGERFGPVFSTR